MVLSVDVNYRRGEGAFGHRRARGYVSGDIRSGRGGLMALGEFFEGVDLLGMLVELMEWSRRSKRREREQATRESSEACGV